MKTKQITIASTASAEALSAAIAPLRALAPNWLLVFGGVDFFARADVVALLARNFPDAAITGCSSAGEISNAGVGEHGCVLTAIRLESATLKVAHAELGDMDDSFAAGARIGAQLKNDGLKGIVVLAPGLQINGTALVEGIASQTGDAVPITGGLAGDGGAFTHTWTLGQGKVSEHGIVAIGLAGAGLSFAHGSFGGWEPFGPARKISRCAGNVLYELDGEPALAIYKRQIGAYAADLPASGLLFPFAMLDEEHHAVGLIRTILGIDEASGSLTLAGTLNPQGYLKLMHASTDRLVNGAEAAAEAAKRMFDSPGDSLAILISCVGRKLVMGERVNEEVTAVANIFGSKAALAGFYSYGEISPFAPGTSCQLHNQTMTITWLGER